ncbi:MAG: hypothetical protein K9H64_11745 [Bacteroidales bacterium]|nr:hypothetical protein [Bacteroidales bacterium]MCF8456663.1 hypothetical protein [Bacteroidales bacterium]
MSKTTDSTFSFESPDLIDFFIRHFKPLAIITTIGAIVSIIVAFSITPRFKSTVVFFPASSSSISNDLLSLYLGSKDILRFGDEEDVEQMIQVLYSEDIRNRVVDKFNLIKHYEIDTLTPYPKTQLVRIWEDQISFRRTEYMSIEIEVFDKDPKIAADIANTIADLVDTAMTNIKKGKALLALKLVEGEYFTLRDEISVVQDSLKKIRLLGINNYETQSEVFYDAYAQGIIKGQTTHMKELEDKLQILSEYGGAYTNLRNQLIYETERLSNLKAKYVEAKVDYEQTLPHKFVVNRAIESEKKTKPVRWLIVSLSTLGTFVFAFIFLIMLEGLAQRLKSIKIASNK